MVDHEPQFDANRRNSWHSSQIGDSQGLNRPLLDNPYRKQQVSAKKQDKKSLLAGRKSMKPIPAFDEIERVDKPLKKQKSKKVRDEE